MNIRTGCDRCKRNFKVTEVDDKGYPLHPHHCNECVKQCVKCGEWQTVSNFLPRLESSAYQDWCNTRTHVGDTPLGLLSGRDAVLDECLTCKPFRGSTPEIRVPVPRADVDTSRLDALLERQRSL